METNPIIGSLNSNGFPQPLKIKKGLTEHQIEQLIEYSSTDESLKKFTGDPDRFATRSGFDEFSTHIIAYYTLVDEKDNLLGIIWFDDFAMPNSFRHSEVRRKAGLRSERIGEQRYMESLKMDPGSSVSGMTVEDYGISFAIRIYASARGHGLAVPFTQKALENFKNSPDYKNHPHPNIWLAVSPDNSGAISVYEKVGFKKVGELKEKNKILMILGK